MNRFGESKISLKYFLVSHAPFSAKKFSFLAHDTFTPSLPFAVIDIPLTIYEADIRYVPTDYFLIFNYILFEMNDSIGRALKLDLKI
jgi:hypothetical protein